MIKGGRPMRVTEYRTMLYLPKSLYLQSVRTAKKRKTSLSALMRDALESYLNRPEAEEFKKAVENAFGLWKNRRTTGMQYENKIRAGWAHRCKF